MMDSNALEKAIRALPAPQVRRCDHRGSFWQGGRAGTTTPDVSLVTEFSKGVPVPDD